MLYWRDQLAIFARWKTFAPKDRKTASLKRHNAFFLSNGILLWCLMFDSHFVCSNCSPSAFVHLFSHSVKLLTALLIGSCGRLSQIANNASFKLDDWLGFRMELIIGLQHPAPGMIVHGLGESGGHRSFLMSSGSWPEAIHLRCMSVVEHCPRKRHNKVSMKFH